MPDLHPLLAPREWARTGGAGLGWKVRFLPHLHRFHSPTAGLIASIFTVSLAKLPRTAPALPSMRRHGFCRARSLLFANPGTQALEMPKFAEAPGIRSVWPRRQRLTYK